MILIPGLKNKIKVNVRELVGLTRMDEGSWKTPMGPL